MHVYIFLFSSLQYLFIVLLHLEGTYPYIYSSIPVIQIFVTKNTFALFPHSVSILFTVSQLNCVSIRETYTHPVFRPQTRRHSLMYLSFQ